MADLLPTIDSEILTQAIKLIQPTDDLYFIKNLKPKPLYKTAAEFARLDFGSDVAANVGATQVNYGDAATQTVKTAPWLYINEALTIFGPEAIQLREALGSGNVDVIKSVLQPHLEEIKRRADRRIETMILQALSGEITYPGGGTLDTEIPASNIITASTAWSTATADILSDISDAKDAIDYATPAILYVPKKVYNAMANNNKISDYIEASPRLSETAITTGKLPNIHGLEIVVHMNKQVSFPTYDDGGTNYYYAIVCPKIDNEWLKWLIGPNPNAASGHTADWYSAAEAVGGAFKRWELIVDLAYFPALANPDAVALIKTGVTA